MLKVDPGRWNVAPYGQEYPATPSYMKRLKVPVLSVDPVVVVEQFGVIDPILNPCFRDGDDMIFTCGHSFIEAMCLGIKATNILV